MDEVTSGRQTGPTPTDDDPPLTPLARHRATEGLVEGVMEASLLDEMRRSFDMVRRKVDEAGAVLAGEEGDAT